jgi:hypothetical protein
MLYVIKSHLIKFNYCLMKSIRAALELVTHGCVFLFLIKQESQWSIYCGGGGLLWYQMLDPKTINKNEEL